MVTNTKLPKWSLHLILENNGQRVGIPHQNNPMEFATLQDIFISLSTSSMNVSAPPGMKVVGMHIEQVVEKSNIVIAKEIPNE